MYISILLWLDTDATYSVLLNSSSAVCACSWPIFEKEELSDPGGRLGAASSGCCFSPGAYMRTNSRILLKSVLLGRWDRIDCDLLATSTRRNIYTHSMLNESIVFIHHAILICICRNHNSNCLPSSIHRHPGGC